MSLLSHVAEAVHPLVTSEVIKDKNKIAPAVRIYLLS